jgi:hypothetical protein
MLSTAIEKRRLLRLAIEKRDGFVESRDYGVHISHVLGWGVPPYYLLYRNHPQPPRFQPADGVERQACQAANVRWLFALRGPDFIKRSLCFFGHILAVYDKRRCPRLKNLFARQEWL